MRLARFFPKLTCTCYAVYSLKASRRKGVQVKGATPMVGKKIPRQLQCLVLLFDCAHDKLNIHEQTFMCLYVTQNYLEQHWNLANSPLYSCFSSPKFNSSQLSFLLPINCGNQTNRWHHQNMFPPVSSDWRKFNIALLLKCKNCLSPPLPSALALVNL